MFKVGQLKHFQPATLFEGVGCVQVSGMSVTITHRAHVNGAIIIGHARATHFTTITLASRNAYVIVGSFEVVPLRVSQAVTLKQIRPTYHAMGITTLHSRGGNHRGCMRIRR